MSDVNTKIRSTVSPFKHLYYFEASPATSDLTGPMPGQSRGRRGQVSSDLIRQDTQRWVQYAMAPVTSRGWSRHPRVESV